MCKLQQLIAFEFQLRWLRSLHGQPKLVSPNTAFNDELVDALVEGNLVVATATLWG